MKWKGSGDGVSDGVVVENRTGEPKHVEVNCQTSKSTVFSEVTRLGPGEAIPYSDLPDRMVQVNARAADGPKGRKMFDPETVSGAIVVGITDDTVAFGTITDPYDPATRDYTPRDASDGGADGDDGSDGGDTNGDGTDAAGDRDTRGKSSNAGRSGRTGSQPARSGTADETSTRSGSTDGTSTRSGSADGTSARSGSADGTSARSGAGPTDPTGGATEARSAGRTASDDTDERGGAGQRASSSDTSPSDAGRNGSDRDEPGAGEIYCRSCGEIIRAKAEICPECGVRNVAQGMRKSSGRRTQSAAASTPRSGAQTSSTGGTQPQGSAGSAQSRGSAGSTQPQGSAGGRTDTRTQPAGSGPSGAWVNGVRIGGVLWFLVLLILIPTVLMYQDVTAGSGLDPGSMLQSLGLAALLPAVQLLAWVVLPVALYFDLNHIGYQVDEWPLHGRLYIAAALVLPIFTQILGAAALFVGGGSVLAAVIPVLMLGLCVRHLRTRSRLL